MRSITDPTGQRWDVLPGRESYGMQVWLFVPTGGGAVRKAMMAAETRLDAEDELQAVSDAALLERLAESVPWEEQTVR